MTVNEKGLEAAMLPCPFCGSDNAMVIGPTCRPETPYNPADRLFPIVRCGSCCAEVSGDNEDYRGKSAIAAWNRRASIVGAEPVLANVLGDENDLHSVSHALDIGGIGTPYRAYQGSLYCDYQPHRIADFQDYGLALAASVLFNSAKAIKAALAHPAPSAGEGGVKGLAGAEYEAIHRRAIEAYEAATPPDYRYSATALRKAVDAARAEEARILTAIEPVAASPGVPDGWRYSINYGPDGQEDWANLIAPDGRHVANIRTHHAIAIVAGMNSPSPAPIVPSTRWRTFAEEQPVAISYLARFFDNELGEWVFTTCDPGPLSITLAAPYTHWIPLNELLAPTSPAPSSAGGDVMEEGRK